VRAQADFILLSVRKSCVKKGGSLVRSDLRSADEKIRRPFPVLGLIGFCRALGRVQYRQTPATTTSAAPQSPRSSLGTRSLEIAFN